PLCDPPPHETQSLRSRGGGTPFLGCQRQLRGRTRRLLDPCDQRPYVNGVASLDEHLGQDAVNRRLQLAVDLLGFDLDQRLALADGFTWLPQPTRHRAFDQRVRQLWHLDVYSPSPPDSMAAFRRPRNRPPVPPSTAR